MARTRERVSSDIGSWQLSDLGAFYSKHKSGFVAHATRLLGDSTRAEEVVHEGLLKVILAAPELHSEEHAKAYVHRTIQNLCIDIFRLEGKRPLLVVIDEAKNEVDESSFHLDPDFADSLTKAEDSAIVRQAISLLSPAERAALVMWEIEERSIREISKELGIKESAVKHTLSRARSSLRRILSNLIVDEENGLTGLDMLSRSYRHAKDFARKSSNVALSILLLLFAFAGFNSFSESKISNLPGNKSSEVSLNPPSSTLIPTKSREGFNSVAPSVKVVQPENSSAKKRNMRFPGLDKLGVPTGFTIADSQGGFGPAYFRERASSSTNSYMSASQVIKTESGAANVFISQTISLENQALSYSPTVSFGRSGEWIPVLASVEKVEIKRLSDGRYLVTAHIAVESEVESPIRITAKAEGRDLDVAPSRLITRLLLDPSRTTVLLQAVYVIESETGA